MQSLTSDKKYIHKTYFLRVLLVVKQHSSSKTAVQKKPTATGGDLPGLRKAEYYLTSFQ